MDDASRVKRAPHARSQPQIVRLGPADAAELHGYLEAKDVWPCPLEQDLVEFLGRNDAVVFATRNPGLVATASGVLERTTLHVQWLLADRGSERPARALIERVESFGRAAGTALLYAHAPEKSQAQTLLCESGFVEDAREGHVVDGRPVVTLALVKVLEPTT